MKLLSILLLLGSFASAQVVPDKYIVELQGPPGVAFASKDGRRAIAADRLARINAEQSTVREALEARQAIILTDIDLVANALVVQIPDALAPSLALAPGVARIYPVMEMHLELDRAQSIHKVPEAVQRMGGSLAGAGLKIAIVDTGIDNKHPGFQDDSLPELPGYPKASPASEVRHTNRKIIVARRYSTEFGGGENGAADFEGHGTGVAMAAVGVPHQAPFAFISGVAPKAYIGNYNVNAGSGRLLDSSVILKALDDAVADGMDVVNMSLGSEPVPRLADDPLAGAIERAAEAGVIVVKSAGNSGPDPNTLTSPGTAPSAITVGATWNDRTFGSGVTIGGFTLFAVPGNGPPQADPIEGLLVDVATLDQSGLACSALESGSLAGKVALILRGSCTFEEKLIKVQDAGAMAALVYSDAARPDAAGMNVGAATLPAMMISHGNGLAIQRRLRDDPHQAVSLRFGDQSFRIDSNQMASFSSRGPTGEDSVKPDLSAVGLAIYTAAQTTAENGVNYDPSGYSEISGTSFSAPLVSGAVAALRAARPGLTAAQYRSLIVNSALMFPAAPGEIGSAQTTGSGLLDLDAAIRGTVAAAPVSITFGAGSSAIEAWRQLSITNLGRTAESYTLTVEGPLGATLPVLSANQLRVEAGASFSVSLFWNGTGLAPGEHQGYILVRGARTEADARIPYWYAVRSETPKYISFINPPETGKPGETVRVMVRVSDGAGLSLFSPELNVTPVAGGGELISMRSIDLTFPGVYMVRLRLGSEPVMQRFRFEAGELSKTLAITAE